VIDFVVLFEFLTYLTECYRLGGCRLEFRGRRTKVAVTYSRGKLEVFADSPSANRQLFLCISKEVDLDYEGFFTFTGTNRAGSIAWLQELRSFEATPLVELEAIADGAVLPAPEEGEDAWAAVRRRADGFFGVWKESFYQTTVTICYKSETDELVGEYVVPNHVTGKLTGKILREHDHEETHHDGLVVAVGEWEEVPKSGRIMRGKFMMTLHPGENRWTGYFQDGTAKFMWEGQKRKESEQEEAVVEKCNGLLGLTNEDPDMMPPEEDAGVVDVEEPLEDAAVDGSDSPVENDGDVPPSGEDESIIMPDEPDKPDLLLLSKFEVGDVITGRWMGGRVWYKGTISRRVGTGSTAKYSIAYDDGDKESNIPDTRIKKHEEVDMLISATVDLNDDNFDEIVGRDTPVFVNWYTTWCGHCKHFYPTYEDIHKALGTLRAEKKVIVARINLEASPILASKYMVEMIPTFMWWPINSTTPLDYDSKSDGGTMVSWIKERIMNPELDRIADLRVTTVPDFTMADMKEHAGGPKHLLVVFYAKWCRYCRTFHRQWESVSSLQASELPNVKLARVDSDEESLLVARYDVRTFPSVFLFFANTSNDVQFSTPRLYESHMDATSVIHWVKYHTVMNWWPRLPPAVIQLLSRTYDYTGGYLISKSEETDIESINGRSQNTAQCGGSLSASVYGEMLAEGIESVIKELALGPRDVFYDLGSGVGKFSLQISMRSQVGMVRGIEYSKTRYGIAVNAIEKLYHGELPPHNATKGRNDRMKGVTHCRHGYCVCVRSMPAMPYVNQTEQQRESCEGGLGKYKNGFGTSSLAGQDEEETAPHSPRLWFENGDIGEFRLNGYDHATHVYTCSTLFSEVLLTRVLGNLRRSRHIKTFTTLKKLPESVFWKHQWLMYLWKTIRVPTTWHIDTEVYIYRFHGR